MNTQFYRNLNVHNFLVIRVVVFSVKFLAEPWPSLAALLGHLGQVLVMAD